MVERTGYWVMKDVKKDFIIKKSKEIFSRFGFTKTTMADIAKAVGMGKSSLYYYFKSKDDVFRDVVEDELDDFKKAIVKSVKLAKDPVEKIRAYILTRIEFINKRSDYYIFLLDEYEGLFEFIEHMREDFSKWEMSKLEEVLNSGVSDGVFDIDNMSVVSEGLFYALKGMEYPIYMRNGVENMQKNVNSYLQVLFHGILK